MATYESKVLSGADVPGTSTDPNVLTGNTPIKQDRLTTLLPTRPMLPPPPQTPDEDLAFRHETYNTMNHAEYERDMLNAGFVVGPNGVMQQGDEFQAGIAQQNFMLRQAQINSWHEQIKMKFDKISELGILASNEKAYAFNKILSQSRDPIYVPQPEKMVPKSTFNERQKQMGLGKIATTPIDDVRLHFQLPDSMSNKDVLKIYAQNIFGLDYAQSVPETQDIINKREGLHSPSILDRVLKIFSPEQPKAIETPTKAIETPTLKTKAEYDAFPGGDYIDSKGHRGTKRK